MERKINQKLQSKLPMIVFLLIIIQPLLDILSFWTNHLDLGNTVTLALRFLILAGFGLLGFCVSRHKRVYYALAFVYIVLLVGHVYACMQRGYRRPVYDLTNFVRVAQMPLFAFCLISCLDRNRRCYRAIEKGLTASFWIIAIALVLSIITGTADPTYEQSGFGIVGWNTFGNSQSAVLAVLVPVVVTLAYRDRNLPVFCLTLIAGYGQLFLMGTRLAYLTIFVTTFGLIIVALITKTVSKKFILVLLAACAVCAATVKQSPMYLNQHQYAAVMSGKQGDADNMIKEKEKDKDHPSPEEKHQGLEFVYHFYSPRMCMRFGTERVMKQYDYTSSVSDITAARRQKIMFCNLVMSEHPLSSHLFGMELGRLQFYNYIYDVENDFHGVYFLFGAVGLALMILFVLYFAYLIARALLADFKKYFTVQAGAFGIAYCLTLLNAYATAGVLRRPNASFYLSVLLAVIYYLVKLKVYPENKKEAAA